LVFQFRTYYSINHKLKIGNEKNSIKMGKRPLVRRRGRGVPQVTYEDIGGLTDEIKKVREMIELPLRHPEIFEKLGIEAAKRGLHS